MRWTNSFKAELCQGSHVVTAAILCNCQPEDA